MIKETIKQNIFAALKGKKQVELKVLRYILSQIKYEEISKQKELSDEEIIALLQKEVKKRKEAIEMFKKGGRNDIVNDEEQQVAIIQLFLPKQLTDAEIKKIIDEVINASTDKANVGKIIGLVMVKVKGKADGKMVAELVKKSLTTEY